MLCRLCRMVGKLWFRMIRTWLITRRQLVGEGVAADNREAAPNENAGADARAFASTIILALTPEPLPQRI